MLRKKRAIPRPTGKFFRRGGFFNDLPDALVRHGTSMGIALSFESSAQYDISVFDLRGVRAGRVTGKLTSGSNFLPLGKNAAACRVIHGFRTNQWE